MTGFHPRAGQSLVEVLVGVALGALFVIGTAGIIAPSLQTNTQVAQVEVRSQLANGLVQNVQSWAAGSWNGVLALATGTLNTYYLQTATSSFSVASGTESLVMNAQAYSRYFYLGDVYRDNSGNVTTTSGGSNYDPSTKLVTVTVAASSTSSSKTTIVSAYIARTVNNVFSQTSWAGGSGQNNPVTLATTSFASANNITVSSTGAFQLSTGGGVCQM